MRTVIQVINRKTGKVEKEETVEFDAEIRVWNWIGAE